MSEVQLVGIEGADEVSDDRLFCVIIWHADHGESESFGVLVGLSNLPRPNLDLGVGRPVPLDFDLVDDTGHWVLGEDVEAGVVVILLDGDSPEPPFSGDDGSDGLAIGLGLAGVLFLVVRVLQVEIPAGARCNGSPHCSSLGQL